jgi:urate oxidase
MAELLACVINSKHVKDFIRQKNHSSLYVYTFNSPNDFITFRYTFKALAVLKPFKRIFTYFKLGSFSVLPEKYLRVFVSGKRLIWAGCKE